ncbi:nucleotidyltransferase family protein [Massilia glaciei]|uniref:Nucleotidyltransferase family protein n=1 Tax=Massilia glaciei TaxID=1524097 RepID=A0A2U2HFN3_9BURK|nr:nucleotidyltransferase family protein [Massilia glaciei]PWF43166.1 nucleotidyltransferase family protein [Massilia glaciei]
MTICGILLAAGSGRRFDPSGTRNKLLAPLAAGQPAVVVATATAMLSVLPRVVAVVPDGAGAVAAALRELGCDVVACPDAKLGMAASLVRALRHCPTGTAGWIIALGDMPYVQAATIAALRDALDRGATIAAPVHAGRRGNPVAFGSVHLEQLLALQGDRGARAIVEANRVTEVPVDDPGIFQDIDTAADLERL